MTTREIYTSAGTIACAMYALAGVAILASDIIRLLLRYDATGLAEPASAACMVVGVLAVCVWVSAARRLKSGEPLSVPKHYRTIAYTLFYFVVVVSLFTDVLPSIKSFHQFVLHCSPLVGSYIIWSIYKVNDAPQA